MHMADGSQRTDYMAMEELKKRAQEHIARGDQPLGETRMLVVKFDTNFDRFAANVAYELRHLVVYRTDGGNFARGLVRQTGQLANFHRELLENSIANGTRVGVAARLYRRANPDPTLRWMMSVQFGRPVIAVSQNEGGQIYASPAVAEQSGKNLAELVLQHAAIVVENPHWSGDGQKRLRDWIKLAQQIGYPGFLDLWYYNRVAVFEYVNWDTTDGRRKAMTTRTAGKLPFDGTTGSMSRGVSFSAAPDTPWRNYPFRNAIKKCVGQRNIDDCHGLIGNELRFAESEIFQSIQEMNKQIKRVSVVAGLDFFSVSGAPSDSLGPLAGMFYKDIRTRLLDPKSLYATYMKYSQDTSGVPIW